jgi:hypothetical protein
MRRFLMTTAACLVVASGLVFLMGTFFSARAQQTGARPAYVLFDTSPVTLKNVRVIDGTVESSL